MTKQDIEILNRCKDLAGDVRRESFGLAIDWILNNARWGEMLVETGRTRCDGEGQSTVILAILAQHLNLGFASIDFDPATTDMAIRLFDRYGIEDWERNVTLFTADSIQTIPKLAPYVRFCYLDSAQSPELEFQEATVLVEKILKPAAILIDDCGPDGGKSVQSVPFLQSRGWKCVACGVNQFQRFLTLD